MNIPQKRILAILLAAALVFSQLSAPALAAEAEASTTPTEEQVIEVSQDMTAENTAALAAAVSAEPEAVAVPVTGIALGQDSLSVPLGGYSTLTCSVYPEDATNQEVLWSSSDETVAIVTAGQVSGVSVGMAVITATAVDGGWTAFVTAVVADIQSPFGRNSAAVTEVASAEQLAGIDLTQGGSYKLMADIILPEGWLPKDVGNRNSIPAPQVIFDGNGHTVTLSGNALFAGINAPCVVKNLKVVGNAASSSENVGAIAVSLSGTLENCISYAAVTQSGYGSGSAGGLAGAAYGGTIANCAVLGAAPDGSSYAGKGALIGYSFTAPAVSNCHWSFDMGIAGNTEVAGTNCAANTTEAAALTAINVANENADGAHIWPILSDDFTPEAPKLSGFAVANNLSFANGTAFSDDVYAYHLTHSYLGSNSFGKITATFNEDLYTAEFVYNGQGAVTLASGSDAWVMDIPYGTTGLTVTVRENNGSQATVYTFTITRPRAAVDTLDESYGGIKLSVPAQTLLQANGDGTPIPGTDDQVLNSHGYYYTLLPSGTAAFVMNLELSSLTVHSRYSVDNGATWTENAMGYSINTEEIAIASGNTRKVIVQLLSDAAYYEGNTGFDGKLSREFTIWVEAPAASGAENTFQGSGTKDSPYLLSSAADLKLLDALTEDGESFSGKYFKLTANITLDSDWDGIGKAVMVYGKPGYAAYDVWYATSIAPFSGCFDGGGYTLTFCDSQPLFDSVRTAVISNLKIQGDIQDDGLIANYAYLKDDFSATATISGITVLSGTTIAGSGLLGGYASGENKVTISDCHIQDHVTIGTAGESRIGGIAGEFNGSISNSSCAATVIGSSYVGGIVAGMGQSKAGTGIENCTFSGSVIATGAYAGGIAGAGYTGSGFGIDSAPNADCIDITDCTVSGSVSGADYVGGILGAEPGVVQCWGGSDAGTITGNAFTGTLNCSGDYAGGIIGYLKSLNKYQTISGNTYKNAQCGIGGITYIDTSCANPRVVVGTTYVNTAKSIPSITGFSKMKTGLNRSDDPLGEDAGELARCLDAPEPAQPTVISLTVNGGTNYKTQYNLGEALDLTGAVFTATWSDGSKTSLKHSEVTVTGYDAQKSGTQSIKAEYKGAKCYITVNVIAAAVNTTIAVTFSMLGDNAHGDNGSVHTLKNGGLTTWISATTYAMRTGSTVLELLAKVCANNGISYSYANNYISSVTRGAVTLAGFTNGARSGWMYTINGLYSDYGVSEQVLSNGDSVVFHYTDDYNIEYGSSSAVGGTSTSVQKTNKDKNDALATLENTGDYQEAYEATGDFLAKQELTAGSDWVVLGLVRSGYEIKEDYYRLLVQYIRENLDEEMRLHKAKSSDNSRTILTLTALGYDATNVEGINLIAGLNSMDYICKQGINGAFWALTALDSGNYPAPGGDVTREKLVKAILDAQLSDGGWALYGETSDPDMTGMALQALAPYYEAEKTTDVTKAVESALTCLSRMQGRDGSFSSGDTAAAESIAQVIVALTALGIDPDTDKRFIKNDTSALDALLAFWVPGEGFRHTIEGSVNGVATEQAYYALTAYDRFLKTGNRLYDMTDILNKGGGTMAAEEAKTAAEEASEQEVSAPEKESFIQRILYGIQSVISWFFGEK